VIRVRPVTSLDYSDLLALNDAAVPAVNRIDRAMLAHLHEQATVCLAAERLATPDAAAAAHAGRPAGTGTDPAASVCAGFLLALDPSADYDSPNFTFFRSRYERFLYVDRIVVAEDLRSRGVGNRLYQALFRAAPDALITCEVNVRPANPGSLRFHQRLGFQVVAEQDTEGGNKRVALMARDAS
jgi:predicted GNAT superfamily acetyltransferase